MRYRAQAALPEHPMDAHWVVVDTAYRNKVVCEANKRNARMIAEALNR